MTPSERILRGEALNDQVYPDEAAEAQRYVIWMEKSQYLMTGLAVVSAIIGVIINFAEIPLVFWSEGPDAQTTPITLLSIVFLAVGVASSGRTGRYAQIGYASAIGALLISVLPHLVGFPVAVLNNAAFNRGSLGLDTSLIIGCIAMSILFRRSFPKIGLAAGLAASALILNGGISQTYGLAYFDGNMALMTLISLIFITVATIPLYLDRPIVRVMFLSGHIGMRTRLMMAVGFVAPWLCGLLLYHWYGVPERSFAVEATLISAIIWVMFAVTLASGFLHERADTIRRQMERQLAIQAVSDPLTGLNNRKGLTKSLSRQWDRFNRFQRTSAILLIDLDNFKMINDTFGHDIGDIVLKSVGNALRPYLRQDDAVGRWGGEEFLCVLNDANVIHLNRISERLRLAIKDISDLPVLLHGKGKVEVSASIGVSVFMANDRGYEAAIRRADEALYAAKRHGRNRVIFDPLVRAMTVPKKVRSESALTA